MARRRGDTTNPAANVLAAPHTARMVALAGLTACATAAPFLILPDWRAFAAAAAAMVVGLFFLARAMRPMDDVARRLERCAASTGATASARGPAARMIQHAEIVAAKLDVLTWRTRRHPVTNLRTRAEFLADITEDFDSADKPTLMGIVRFANYEQMAAFDQPAAERALSAFARRLENAVDKRRPIAHVDRDCFAIWFRGAAAPKQAAAELQAISYALGEEIKEGDLIIAPDIQVGSALFPIDSEDPAALLTRATVALARPQRTAAGGVAFFAARSPSDARRRFSLEQDLRRAMHGDQLQLAYQPLVDVKERRVVGAEALLRWRHPQLGPISPSEFVPILEESGLVHEIGLWTLNAACRQGRAWRDAGVTDIKVAVNLSAQQLRDPSLKTVMQATLERYELKPAFLEIELTETAAMEDAERTLALFRDLQQSGFGLAIDDFGAGYSSLSYLKKLPFSKLKIDREFVSHVDSRPNSRAICKALVELAAGLNITVLAEGVERREEVEELRQLGCSVFQGFYFARPLGANDFLRTVRDPEWLTLLASPVHRERAELKRRMTR